MRLTQKHNLYLTRKQLKKKIKKIIETVYDKKGIYVKISKKSYHSELLVSNIEIHIYYPLLSFKINCLRDNCGIALVHDIYLSNSIKVSDTKKQINEFLECIEKICTLLNYTAIQLGLKKDSLLDMYISENKNDYIKIFSYNNKRTLEDKLNNIYIKTLN